MTTSCTPPMSFASRDCTSPVRVRVKKASERRCRCLYTEVRRSCITRCPTWFESSVCTTPSAPVTTAIAIIPATSTLRRPRSPSGSATSKTSRIRNAGIAPSTDEKTISPRTAARRRRYGRKRRTIRRRWSRRTAGSAGRSTGSRLWKERPRGIPHRVRIGYRSAATRCSSSRVRSRAAATVGRRRNRDLQRLADDDADARKARRGRARAPAVEPTIRTGTSGTPVASARRAAPRVQAPPRIVPCGKIATDSPARRSSSARSIATWPSRPRVDRDPAERVHQPGDRAPAPQLLLREEPERLRSHEREERRVEHRLVVRREDARVGRTRPDDLEPVEHAREQPRRLAAEPVDA